jgi:hypothetical protein
MEALLVTIIVITFGALGLLLISPLMIGALFLIEIFFGGFVEGRRHRKG